MPERIFDGSKLRDRRVIARKSQTSVAEDIGVRTNQVSKWETNQATPPQERLPGIARAVDADLDELFPRLGPPDLIDLRCDAGMTRADTTEFTKTRSAMAVRSAEEGKRPLSEEHELALSKAYGVTLAELRAAQKRSFGYDVPVVAPLRVVPAPEDRLPDDRVIADRIAYVRDEVYGGDLPSDAEIASAGNRKSGRPLLTEDLVRALREGTQTQMSEEVLDALALALNLPPVYMHTSDPQIARLVVSAQVVRNRYTIRAARGGESGIPEAARAELADFISDTMAEILGPETGGTK
ncbi:MULTISPECIES: helix-turn-helix transcriptional regulator [Streptomyces]|uniref:XRE family transcriptional regulator n=1 Tax=Streptomyces zinciresistens K42 TaxID=700597 RepID=G2G739_9ACTN|nr:MULTISPECIES: helix-turn-helix transcriptional regulator [Streptomyces]EGX60580.1 XRE family transcriptional regulator [Streptomyces zinciresistens K42]MDT9695950.1 helix-turn-helix transcriptional regulator [Streptomyces sp. P17]